MLISTKGIFIKHIPWGPTCKFGNYKQQTKGKKRCPNVIENIVACVYHTKSLQKYTHRGAACIIKRNDKNQAT